MKIPSNSGIIINNVRSFLILCLLCMGGSLFALEGFFAGLSTEINANSPRGPGISGGITLGLDWHQHGALGLKTAYNPNLFVSGALESLALVRYYLAPGCMGPFAQAEAGLIYIFAIDEDYLVFNGGLTTGWRFSFGANGYMEPALRVGYPFLWGLGVTAGLRFQFKKSPNE